MKTLIIIAIALFISGCSTQTDQGKQRQLIFIAKYGSEHVRVCENGFLVVRYFYDSMNKETSYLVTDAFESPIRCEKD